MPFPSLADAGWIVFYVPTFAGIILLAQERTGRRGAASVLDGAIAAPAISGVGAAIAFGAIVEASGGSPLAIATNLAYPLGDLLLLALVVGVLASAAGGPAAWAGVGLGLAVFAVADALYLFQIAEGPTWRARCSTPPGRAALAITALAAWEPGGSRRRFVRRPGARVLVPALFAWSASPPLVYRPLPPGPPLALALDRLRRVRDPPHGAHVPREPARCCGDQRPEATHRFAHRAGQPPHAPGRPRGGPRGQQRRSLLVALRPRRLQGLQRHLRPSRRRRAARAPRRELVAARSPPRRRPTASAATSSACSRPARATRRDVEPRPRRRCASTARASTITRSVRLGRAAATTRDAPATRCTRRPADVRARRAAAGAPPAADAATCCCASLHEREPELHEHSRRGRARRARSAARLGLDAEDELRRGRAAPPSCTTSARSRSPTRSCTSPARSRGGVGFMRQHTIIGERILGAAPALARSRARPLQPRALGRQRLPRRAGRRRDPARRADRRRLRRLRRDDLRPPLPRRRRPGRLAELRRCAGTQFDPEVVAAFAAVLTAPAVPLAAA